MLSLDRVGKDDFLGLTTQTQHSFHLVHRGTIKAGSSLNASFGNLPVMEALDGIKQLGARNHLSPKLNPVLDCIQITYVEAVLPPLCLDHLHCQGSNCR